MRPHSQNAAARQEECTHEWGTHEWEHGMYMNYNVYLTRLELYGTYVRIS